MTRSKAAWIVFTPPTLLFDVDVELFLSAMTNSTRSRLSASRDSKVASGTTALSSTDRTSTAHFLNRSKLSLTALLHWLVTTP